jgi:hypothetical protein
MTTGDSSICQPQPLGLAASEVLDSIRHQAPSVEQADNPSSEGTGHPSGMRPTSRRDERADEQSVRRGVRQAAEKRKGQVSR